MEGMEGLTRYYNSKDDAVRAAVELYGRHAGQTNNLVFATTRRRYKYLIVGIVSIEKNRCVAQFTYEITERKIIEKLQLPDGTTKTVVLTPRVFKLVHFRFITN